MSEYEITCRHESGHFVVARNLGRSPRSHAASHHGMVIYDPGSILQNAAVAVAGKLAEDLDDIIDLRSWFEKHVRSGWARLGSSADKIKMHICPRGQQWEAVQLSFRILTEHRGELDAETKCLAQECSESSDLDPVSSRAAADEFLEKDRQCRREAQIKEALRVFDDLLPTPKAYNMSTFMGLIVLTGVDKEEMQRGAIAWGKFTVAEAVKAAGRPNPGKVLETTIQFLKEFVRVPEQWRSLAREFNRFRREHGEAAQ